MTRTAAAAAALALVLAAAPAWTGWREVARADAALDLVAAREEALATAAADPLGPDGLAAAAWWLDRIDTLSEPQAILAVVPHERDPELGALLARIEAVLAGGVPAGVLRRAELSGPFGVFDTLDIERAVVPADRNLPPLPTPWSDAATPFRLAVMPVDGWIAPAGFMMPGGVFLAAWTFEVEQAVAGWLLLETEASVNVHVDGREVARLREPGVRDPEAIWIRLELAPGAHRVRVEMASREQPRVRLSALDERGAPLALARVDGLPTATAPSDARVAEPAAAAAAQRTAAARTSAADLRLAAELRRLRGDPQRQRSLLEDAAAAWPDDPMVALDLADLFLSQPTGADPQVDFRRAQDALRQAAELPRCALVEHAVARRQRREDDAERILDRLAEGDHATDPRVEMLWVGEALRRGWTRDAVDRMERLHAALPESRRLAGLLLEALAALERWEERGRLLESLAERGAGADLDLLEELVSECRGEHAVRLLSGVAADSEDPFVDRSLIQLLVELGRTDEARARLEAAEDRWGRLETFDQLHLVLEADSPHFDRLLEAALQRDPSNLELRSLAWRRGAEPFWAPFAVDEASWRSRVTEEVAADAVLLLDQAVERLFDDGSSLYYYHGVSRAVTPQGARQVAELQQMDDALRLTLRIIKPDGRVVVPAESRGEGGGLVLADVGPGDVIEEEYVAPVAPTGASRRAHMSPYVYRFADPERAFGLSEYVLLVPDGVEPAIDGLLTPLEHERWRREDGLTVMRWRARDMPPLPDEPFAPPVQELLPWVTYGHGVTWEDAGDVLRDRVLAALCSSVDLERFVASHLVGETAETRVAALVDALVDEVEEGGGPLDLRRTAGESFSLRRGNRLGILAAGLAGAGWSVDLVLTRPRPFAGTHREVPSLDVFTVPVLRVAAGDDTVWVDLSEGRRGVGHLRPLLQGSDALELPLTRPAARVGWIEALPEFPNPELEEVLRLDVRLDAEGNGDIRVEMPVGGARGQQLAERLAGLPADRLEIAYRQLAVGLMSSAERVGGSHRLTPDGVVLELEMRLPRLCEVEGDAVMSCRELAAMNRLSPSLASLPSRRHPLVLALPIIQRLELRLVPPPGWAIARPPRQLWSEWGTVEESIEQDGAAVTSRLQLEVPAQTVAPEQYAEFARFCRAVDELIGRPPVLERRR